MPDWDPSLYGERIAEVYDELYGTAAGVDAAVATLARLVEEAGGGPALELGIGTGRLALPLAGSGVDVHGIDASAAMVARLRAKPGGERIPVTVADFAEVPAEGRFALVFCAFNTFFHLDGPDAQAACFAAVAAHLADGGRFALECFVPEPDPPRQGVEVLRVDADALHLAAWRRDPATGVTSGHLVALRDGDVRLCPWRLRPSPPAELDAMAGRAGLALAARWADWAGTPFDPAGAHHVSIYRAGIT